MDGEMTMEQYLVQEIEDGYINDKYAPIKCYCGCSDFTDVKQQYEEHMLVEYQVKCNSCGKAVGHWAYGQWTI